MRSKPSIIVAPDFRRMDEIFDPETRDRLDELVDVRWGKDGPMPAARYVSRHPRRGVPIGGQPCRIGKKRETQGAETLGVVC